MTAKHLIDGLMLATRSHTHRKCAIWLGVEEAVFSRIVRGTQVDFRVQTIDLIQRRTGIAMDQLIAWYRLPDGAELSDCVSITCHHRRYVVDESTNRVLCAECRELLDPVWVLLQIRHRHNLDKTISRASA